MPPDAAIEAAVEATLGRAIALYNAGRRAEAEALCATMPPHPAVQQLQAVLCHERGDLAAARRHASASLAARPGHAPTLMVLALVAQDQRDLAAAEAALCAVLAQQPDHAAASLNLGIVHLQQGRRDEALCRFGAAWRQRPQAFGRIAMALSSESTGALWLDAAALKAELAGA